MQDLNLKQGDWSGMTSQYGYDFWYKVQQCPWSTQMAASDHLIGRRVYICGVLSMPTVPRPGELWLICCAAEIRPHHQQ